MREWWAKRVGGGRDDWNNLVSLEPLESNIPRKLSIRRGHPFKEHFFFFFKFQPFCAITERKNGQRTWVDICPKKIHRWPLSTWKNVRHRQSLGNFKSKPQWASPSSHTPGGVKSTKLKMTSVGKDVEKLNLAHCWWESINKVVPPLWHSMAVSQEGEHRIISYHPTPNVVVGVRSLSHVWLFVTPETAALRLPRSSPSPRVCSDSCPLIHDAIQPSHPLSPPSPQSPGYTPQVSEDKGCLKGICTLTS